MKSNESMSNRSLRGTDCFLSEHFRLSEFTYSRVAIENGIDNTPPPEVVQALQALCRLVLEPLREKAGGQPMHILSGYRCAELNRRVGGVVRSQHLTGEAADVYMVSLRRLLQVLRLPGAPEFDQAIFYPKRNFIHLSYSLSGRNRKQILYA